MPGMRTALPWTRSRSSPHDAEIPEDARSRRGAGDARGVTVRSWVQRLLPRKKLSKL